MTDTVKPLSDEALREIEAREPETAYALGQPLVSLTPEERDSLCATVRALRAERLEIQRTLASAVLEDPAEDDQPPYSTTELVEGVRWLLRMKEMKQERVTALREQLAEAIKARDLFVSLKRGQTERADEIEARALELLKERDELQSQLAQVTQESDEWRTVAEKYQSLVARTENDAATRMRDRCVEKVRELRYSTALCTVGGYVAALANLVDELESLTLEQGEQEK